MFQALNTDFIKNPHIQLISIAGLFLDLLCSGSIIHIAMLFGLPYSLSVLLNYLFRSQKSKPHARISAQYRPKEEWKQNR